MPAVQAQCPNCSQSYSIDSGLTGKVARCRRCQQPFTLNPSGEGSRADASDPGPSPNERPIPDRLGRFVIRERIGAGAFGTVYRAYDPVLDREVALKVPQAGTLGSPRAVERFMREAKAAARLRHPHIVPIYDAGQDGDFHYIASAFIAGRTLQEAIADGGLDLRQSAQVVREMAEALAYAHGLGIVHRDVKPANAMLDGEGRAHVMDFGLAHRLDSAENITLDGVILGTPAYMAPEQAAGKVGAPLPASDQYSLGVVLHELLCGETPFSGPQQVILFNAQYVEPQKPRQRNPKVPLDLETICLKAMAKRPEDRYASCRDLADDLRRWQEGEPIPARRSGPVERATRWARRNAAVAGLAATVVVLMDGTIRLTYFAYQARRKTAEFMDLPTRVQRKTEEEAARARRADLEGERSRQIAAQAQRKTEEEAARARRADPDEEPTRQLEEERTRQIKEEILQKAQMIAKQEGYLKSIQSAKEASDSNQNSLLLKLLDEQQPKRADDKDLRGWEWHYLKRLSQPHLVNPRGQARGITSVAFSPDGARLASGGADGAVRLRDAATGRELRILAGHTGDVTSVAFSPDGTRLASGGADGTVRLWDAGTGRELLNRAGHAWGVTSVAFSPGGGRIASGGADGTVHLRDAATGDELRILKGHAWGFTSVAFSPDGARLASGGADGAVRLWDTATGRQFLAFNVFKGDPKRGPVEYVAFSPDGARLASGDLDGAVRLWDTGTGEELLNLGGHAGGVTSVAFSPDGARIASGGADGTVRLRDTATGRELLAFSGRFAFNRHAWGVTSVAFSPDGARLASGGADGTVRLWDTTTGGELRILKGHAGGVTSVAFSPDGARLASGGADGAVRLRDAVTGRELRILAGHAGGVTSVAFSPDGARVVSGGGDKTVRLWDVATGRELRILAGHAGGVTSVAFSPDGARVVSGGGDKTVRFWDAATGRELLALEGYAEGVTVVAFSRDGARVVSGGGEGLLVIWDGTPLP